MIPVNLAPYVAICDTAGCENDGVPIEVLAATDAVGQPLVYCGACTDEDGLNRRILTVLPLA